MNSLSPFMFLAAVTDEGVLLHDIIGGVVLAVLLLIGILFHQRQHRQVASPNASLQSPVDRSFAKVQIWLLYWLAVGAVIAFFFIWPRADTRTERPSEAENAKGQKL
ncbi:MAG: hypothetical protein ACO1TE_02285 [Prosthecobacter sp.]